MNLDLDFSVVTRFFRGIVAELRQKKLWPAAVVLLAALVAVPLLLSKSSSPAPVAQAPLPTPPPSPATTLPAINEQSTPAHSRLTGSARDPFRGVAGAAASSTTSAAATTTAVSTAVSTASTAAQAAVRAVTGGSSPSSQSGPSGSGSPTSGSGTSSSSTSSPASSPVSGAPSPIAGHTKPSAAPSGLASKQSYQVALAITTPSGGLNTIDPLERLTILPTRRQPLLVELGVLRGGKRVLFAVQPGAAVKGRGTCIPGPLNCEVLSVGKGQTEAVGLVSAAGVSWSALFAVTRIRTVDHSSAAAAQRARRASSPAGQELLRNSPLSALSLFAYEPSLGAVRDLRNLTVERG